MKFKLAIAVGFSLLLIVFQRSNHKLPKKKNMGELKKDLYSQGPAPHEESASKRLALSGRLPAGVNDPSLMIKEAQNELLEYQTCRQNGNCQSSEADSRSQEFESSQVLTVKLRKLNERVIHEHLQSLELVALAQELLKTDDGAIKEEALKLMLSQEPQPENIEAITIAVFGDHDGNLVALALGELQRHLQGSDAQQVHSTLKNCLLTGSLLVRQSLSERLGPFINSGSYEFYRELNRSSRIDAPVRRNIQAQLREWQMQESGG